MNERKDVYKLPPGDNTLEWYGKAVLEMQKLPATNPLSWKYQAAMHGFDAGLSYWHNVGPIPGNEERNTFWKQCQHGSWYFLPWHRMYLAFFEQIVAKTIVDLGGPGGWTLPFWNYSDQTNNLALNIPAAFTNPANTANGLWMADRVNNTLDPSNVTLEALGTIPYAGDGLTSELGFGGPETTFAHNGKTHGGLEGSIHDNVHGDIGGAMGDPRTAGLDPIFWLHHANIDRLWQVWLNQGNRTNPTKTSWLDLSFNFHDSGGNQVALKVGDVVDTQKVLNGYTYQGVLPGLPSTTQRTNFIAQLNVSPPLEVTAASNKKLVLRFTDNFTQLILRPSAKKKANFVAINQVLSQPQKVVLHFENIKGKGVPPIHKVYLNPPKNAKQKNAYYAGSLSFFGIEEASKPGLHSSGSGQHYALDVSDLMSKLRTLPNWDEKKLNVDIEATRAMPAGTSVTIGRISLYSS